MHGAQQRRMGTASLFSYAAFASTEDIFSKI